ncbi:hypothetical protein CYMTET_7291 [Cymbomonas tetramitiformis]|uniref:Uncharacterized protein n=1 Tax=Cymbomonas tetramitiformis TaxID=36881 RepID=A0AAE0GVY4_9CHLO|nr:hypothetical protein CYMTET_7291 [Cymbomonas tetramitiformis]
MFRRISVSNYKNSGSLSGFQWEALCRATNTTVRARGIIGWATGWKEAKEEVDKENSSLSRRVRELEDDTAEHLQTVADLQKELQRVRSELVRSQSRVNALQSDKRALEINKHEAVATVRQQYDRADRQAESLRAILVEIHNLTSASVSDDTRAHSVRAPASDVESVSHAAEDAHENASDALTIGGIKFASLKEVSEYCSMIMQTAPLGHELVGEERSVLVELLQRGSQDLLRRILGEDGDPSQLRIFITGHEESTSPTRKHFAVKLKLSVTYFSYRRCIANIRRSEEARVQKAQNASKSTSRRRRNPPKMLSESFEELTRISD